MRPLIVKFSKCFAKDYSHLKLRFCSSNSNNYVKIGNLTKNIIPSKNPELIPTGYFEETCSHNIRAHLQWIMKKDLLGQDIFLLGLPGPLRRRIALQYSELTEREVEYIVLSRDTTESDLKQRREIYSGTAYYKDQSAIKAAINGRILILDGVEKAERNVLPILNNLLENREVQLEDGRFLVAPERYDKLLIEHSKQILDSWNLVRVSENFRVIALGLPVPQFRGHPLDPPFRSRFQSRDIHSTFEEQFIQLNSLYPNIPSSDLQKFIALTHTFLSEEAEALNIPKFPIENLETIAKLLNHSPNLPTQLLFKFIYPYDLILPSENKKYVEETLKKFNINKKLLSRKYFIEANESSNLVQLEINGLKFSYEVLKTLHATNINNFINNKYHDSILSDMLLSHFSSDFCLIGSKGSGKTMLVKKFAELINSSCEMIMLYKDMTSRDLLQHRITNPNGDTVWELSNLVKSALQGKIVVLDGLHRLHQSTLSVLQRLIHDRELQLYDGSRLLRHDRYDVIKNKHEFSDEVMSTKGIFRIHPSFRIIALAEPPKTDGYKDQWLTPEVLSMFLFHNVRPLSLNEEKYLIEQLAGPVCEKMQVILNLAHTLRNSSDVALVNISNSLSTRQLVRIAQRLSTFPHQDIYSLISQACLIKFLPQLAKQAAEKVFEDVGICQEKDKHSTRSCTVKDGMVTIGGTTIPVYDPKGNQAKVPNILFYDTQEHLTIMEAMLQDFILGEHLLLIGNQGVGKNKIVDKFLQLLNRPREYIQLHRDTTVQSLTQQPSVIDGKIIYEDSPLVKAIKNGHVLVVDEADKAPTHVTCILKALVESGEMILSDGRRIMHHSDPLLESLENKNFIKMHPDFRMIILANRPGFPFLGNDFFATLGDIFSCHAVENPSVESEITMLRQYGPNVPSHMLEKLVRLFGDLRYMSDSGVIAYPYSMREVVNITKHLEKFSNEGLPMVLRNVFDFDSHNSELKQTLTEVFHKHGIPFGAKQGIINLAKSFSLPKPQLFGQWTKKPEIIIPSTTTHNLNISDPSNVPVYHRIVESTQARAAEFSEQDRIWELPLDDYNIPVFITTTRKENTDMVHIVTSNPITIMTLNTLDNSLCVVDMSDFFPSVRRGFKPILKLAGLGNKLTGSILLHEKNTNQIFIINPITGLVSEINISNIFELTLEKLSKMLNTNSKQTLNFCADLTKENIIFLYGYEANKIIMLDLNKLKVNTFHLPSAINFIQAINKNSLIFVGETKKYIADISHLEKWELQDIEEKYENESNFDKIQSAASYSINSNALQSALETKENTNSTICSTNSDYFSLIANFPTEGKGNLFRIPRKKSVSDTYLQNHCILSNNGQIIRKVLSSDIPDEYKSDTGFCSSFLEVIDIGTLTCSYIPLPHTRQMSSVTRWLSESTSSYLLISSTENEDIITVDNSGHVRKWQTAPNILQNSLNNWFEVTGVKNNEQLTIEKGNSGSVSHPKHGKIDPTNAPHVGGNTWAGGTGGRDTAGLGGKGGPYRLDAGHNVFQIPDSEKDAVPEEVRKAAREMGLKAYKDRLKEIDMSEYDAELYEKFSHGVKKQVNILRTILDSLQAKSKERQWLKHQTTGELDDTKLIEGITGEKSIYKRRGEEEPELGSPQEKPKKLRLLVDVSGSMYRFNGHDSRLERELECIVLVMEAFDGYKDKFQYDIIGHSGEDFFLKFSSFENPPKNNKERLTILQKMHAHSQFCMSGDNTLRATKYAIEDILKEDGDEYFLVAMSDANFDRYGISPKSFGNLLTSQSKVNSFAIFIGTLGNQAQTLQKNLPPGRGFICLDTKQLPQILQRIFTSSLLHDD